jgi:lipoyl(octanoyl) transferase
MSQLVRTYHLGSVPYEPAWELQRRLQHELISAKRSFTAPPPHVLLIVEHPHVFTIGKSGDPSHLLARGEQLTDRHATYLQVDRGGDITYHGPGQLVAYPILDLDRIRYPDGRRGTDIHRYLRELEGSVIDVCASYGLDADRVMGRTGVWVPADERGPARKICAFGIRCSRWVTMHGLAFNIEPDLSYFDLIIPCGITDGGVTSLTRELDRPISRNDVIERFLDRFAERFDVAIEEHELPAWISAAIPVDTATAAPSA